jgi:transposase
MPKLWVGIDAGKREHHCVVIDEVEKKIISQRVENDELTLLELIATITALADGDEVIWATDLNAGGGALLISLLATNGQTLLYIPGRIIHHASATYRGDGKTDAKDAAIIADQARMRRDLQPVRSGDQINIDLQILTSYRTDVMCDRVRAINRLRAMMLEYFPALERAFDYSKNKAALVMLSTYQTPEQLRRVGRTRLAAWLKAHGCRNSATVASNALDAAEAQHTTLATQAVGAAMVARLAGQVAEITATLAVLDRQIDEAFQQHEHAARIVTMPGFGPLLGATFLAATGGTMDAFDSADKLATVAGLAPSPRDSGRISGNLHRPRRFNRRLLRTCYLAALSSLKNSPASRTYYDRKRREGKSHKQALLALARRRNNVLWAMLRDGTDYREPTTSGMLISA